MRIVLYVSMKHPRGQVMSLNTANFLFSIETSQITINESKATFQREVEYHALAYLHASAPLYCDSASALQIAHNDVFYDVPST